jgi:hypothetical protein
MTLLPYHRGTGPKQRGLGGRRHPWILLAALAAVFFLSQPIGAEPPKEIRRVLILNEVGISYPGIAIINAGIQAALNDSPYRLEFYSEYMDTGLFPDPPDQQEFRDFYLRKYRKRKPHVIITVGPSALKFMKEVHQTAFPGVPIVFCLPAAGAPGAPALDSDFTGVENDMAPAKTLEIALRLRPGTEHVVVVNGGIANFDKQQLTSIKQQLKAFTDHLDITYITELAMPDLLERLRHLPSHTLDVHQPFSHTGETKSSSQNCHSGVKAKSRIPTTPAIGFPLSIGRNLSGSRLLRILSQAAWYFAARYCDFGKRSS